MVTYGYVDEMLVSHKYGTRYLKGYKAPHVQSQGVRR